MTNRPAIAPNNAGDRLPQSWTDQHDDLATFTLDSNLADVPFEQLRGAESNKADQSFTFGLIFEYSATTRQTRYRRGEAIPEVAGGRPPPDSCWVEIDPRMTLTRALQLYGRDLLAYEKRVRRRSLEIVFLVCRRNEETLKVLIRRPEKAS